MFLIKDRFYWILKAEQLNKKSLIIRLFKNAYYIAILYCKFLYYIY